MATRFIKTVIGLGRLAERFVPCITRGPCAANLVTLCRPKTHRGIRGGARNHPSVQPSPHLITCDLKNSVNNGLRMALLNTRSVKNKATEINNFITENTIDVLCMTETWLRDDGRDGMTLAELLPPAYKIEHKPRAHGRGGGVGIVYVDSGLSVKLTNSTPFPSFEHLCLNVCSKSMLFHIVLVYRPPPSKKNKCTFLEFLENFSDLLSDVVLSKGKLIIQGDFNIHIENPIHTETSQFNALIQSYNLHQHVAAPTHINGGTLDLILTRSSETTIANLEVVDPLLSDHSTVMFDLPTVKPSLPKRCITYRDFKSLKLECLKNDIRCSALSQCTANTVDEQTDLYNNTLSNLIEKHAPLKTRTLTIRPLAPWYCNKIHAMRKAKRKAEKLWKKTKLTIHRQIFANRRTDLTNQIKLSRKNYFQNKIESSSDNQKVLFQCVDELLYKTKTAVMPHDTPNPQDAFSEFFINKIKQIQLDFVIDDITINNQTSDATQHYISTFQSATHDEVKKLIKSSATKSCCLDPIPTFLLKECIDELTPAITTLINLSLSQSVVPPSLKSAVVTPILKKKHLDQEQLKNYRPISNLPFVSKILEKVVSSRLSSHKTENNLRDENQSAYRTGHSTETALVRVQNDFLRAIDNGQCVFLVLLDLSAAFDTVSHNILLDRLSSRIGIKSDAHRWVSSYLCNRTQSVLVAGIQSDTTILSCGVPQGSVLGPNFFTDYISPVASIIHSYGISYHCYADDTQIYAFFKPGENELQTLHRLEMCIDNVRSWMAINRLKLNDDKTEFIMCGSAASLKKIATTSIKIGNQNIFASHSVRNIGVIFDAEMKMEQQINQICKSAWFHLYRISKIYDFMTKEQATAVIHGYITSKLDNCNSLLFGIPQKHLAKLQRIQNAAARLLTKSKKRDHITPILRQLHWLPISQRIIFKILLLTFKALYCQGPLYHHELLTFYKPSYSLRSASDHHRLVIPKTLLKTYGDRAFSVAVPIMWNNLPTSIKSSQSVSAFKIGLKTFLFKEYFN